jgi:hypothetical protein
MIINRKKYLAELMLLKKMRLSEVLKRDNNNWFGFWCKCLDIFKYSFIIRYYWMGNNIAGNS